MDDKKFVVTPGWAHAAERIGQLGEAIQYYAKNEHGPSRRTYIRLWAEEILMQCDIWDKVTDTEMKMSNVFI